MVVIHQSSPNKHKLFYSILSYSINLCETIKSNINITKSISLESLRERSIGPQRSSSKPDHHHQQSLEGTIALSSHSIVSLPHPSPTDPPALSTPRVSFLQDLMLASPSREPLEAILAQTGSGPKDWEDDLTTSRMPSLRARTYPPPLPSPALRSPSREPCKLACRCRALLMSMFVESIGSREPRRGLRSWPCLIDRSTRSSV